jgi:prepilin-type N-terminal cleavage/methylation domain-containing protein
VETLKKTRRDDKRITADEKGLTLIELMVALGMFLIVVAGIYNTFVFQQEAYLQTESKVNMVQEARAAQFFLARDLKMAGYDPSCFADTGFNQAAKAETSFSMDIAGNGEPASVEITRFALTTDDGETVDDGLCPEDTTCRLSREWCSDDGTCGGLQPIAENVEALELCYIIDNMRATTTPTALDRERITSVIVSLLMRQSYRSNKYRNTDVYIPASGNAVLTPNIIGDRADGWGPFNDTYRRKLVVFEVKARNIGMNPYPGF